MNRRLIIAPIARDDLEQIWDFIARDSIDAADRVRDEIESAMLQLAEMPGMGHHRQDVTDKNLRFWNVYSYLIAYRYTETELRVARVVSGYRDLKKMFRSR